MTSITDHRRRHGTASPHETNAVSKRRDSPRQERGSLEVRPGWEDEGTYQCARLRDARTVKAATRLGPRPAEPPKNRTPASECRNGPGSRKICSNRGPRVHVRYCDRSPRGRAEDNRRRRRKCHSLRRTRCRWCPPFRAQRTYSPWLMRRMPRWRLRLASLPRAETPAAQRAHGLKMKNAPTQITQSESQCRNTDFPEITPGEQGHINAGAALAVLRARDLRAPRPRWAARPRASRSP